LKTHVPESVLIPPANFVKSIQLRRARRLINASSATFEYLAFEEIERLDHQFRDTSFAASQKNYSDEQEMRVASERLKKIYRRVPGIDQMKNVLELGCGTGACSRLLSQNYRIHTTGVDQVLPQPETMNKTKFLDFIVMDAQDLKFDDQSFDLIFSFDAFEHIANPEKALKEAHRVLRPGGYLYLYFGPLFPSSLGLHLYNRIKIPYCQFLFRPEDLNKYLSIKNRGSLDKSFCNGWSILDFRNLFDKMRLSFDTHFYQETPDLFNKGPLWKWPSCFRKVDDPESLFVSFIEVLLQKPDKSPELIKSSVRQVR